MKLYLDDIRPCPIGWTYAQTVQEAQRIILATLDCGIVWEDASLDHDLGACAECYDRRTEHWIQHGVAPHCEHYGTGYDLLRWMIDQKLWPLRKPTVHSFNFVRAKEMREDIDRYFPETVIKPCL
jgi:hypothetical protein